MSAPIDPISLARQELEKTAEGLNCELELARSKVKILEEQAKTVKAAIKAMTPKPAVAP